MELHELHEKVRQFERNRTEGRTMWKVIEPESNCPWCKVPAKYIRSRSDGNGRNTGVHVFFCRNHGWYESEGGNKPGKPIKQNEV